jgi:hypothetical protein
VKAGVLQRQTPGTRKYFDSHPCYQNCILMNSTDHDRFFWRRKQTASAEEGHGGQVKAYGNLRTAE